MADKYKFINKFLDYCFKNLDKVYASNDECIRIKLDKDYSLFVSDNSATLYIDGYELLYLEGIPQSEYNLIKYKISKLNEEHKQNKLTNLENIIDNIDNTIHVTNIEDFSYDEDRC